MKFHDWQTRLAAVIDASHTKEFSYGTFDCALFAANCVQAITGIDYAASLRGYHSKIDAYRIVSSYGSLEAMITGLLGSEPIHQSLAQPGDVVLGLPALQQGEQGEEIGICLGVKFAFPAQVGLVMHGIGTCRLAWRIN